MIKTLFLFSLNFCLFKIICGNIIHHPNRIYKLNFLRYDMPYQTEERMVST